MTAVTNSTTRQGGAATVARLVGRTLVGATSGGTHPTRDGFEWHIQIPAAEGSYQAKATVVTSADRPAALMLRVDAHPDGGGGFAVPGGYSEMADFGELLHIRPQVVAEQVVTVIVAFEQQAPTLALHTHRVGVGT